MFSLRSCLHFRHVKLVQIHGRNASISFHVSHLVKVYSITSLYSLFMCVETHKITLASLAPARFLPPVLANLVC